MAMLTLRLLSRQPRLIVMASTTRAEARVARNALRQSKAAEAQQKVLPPIHANAGVRMRYQRRLQALIDEMAASIEHWMGAQYNDTPPALAADASPSKDIQRRLRVIAAKWRKRFEDAAPDIAEAYLKGQFKATDSAMRQALKDAGFTVKFEMTAAMKDAFNASLAENVGLIRSIPEQYLQQVQGVVARSYSVGRDLATMVKELKQLHPVANNRAMLIARDQSNKANAVVTRARQMELGITQAKWLHSHGGKTPRPDHLAADGKLYDVEKGMLLDDGWVFPGQLIMCRCVGRSVLSSLMA
jgi:uncharacterized protein with gpF-like domain